MDNQKIINFDFIWNALKPTKTMHKVSTKFLP